MKTVEKKWVAWSDILRKPKEDCLGFVQQFDYKPDSTKITFKPCTVTIEVEDD